MRFLRRSITICFTAVLLLSACAQSVTPTPRTSTALPANATPAPTATAAVSKLAITGVTVIDVEEGVAVPAQTVLVLGDRIDQIKAREKLVVPEGARVIDGHGLYLMPALVDAHVHYFDAPVFGRLMLANGVLLVRDVGMPTDIVLELRDGLSRGETLGPEMVATGAMIDGSPPWIPSISVSVNTPEEARAAVRAHAAAGVDEIKLYANLTKDEFLAIVDEARKNGLKSVAHLGNSVSLEDAAAAGLGSSEHWFGFEKAIAGLLGEAEQLSATGMGSDADYLQRLDEVDPKALQAFYQRLRASGLTVCPTVVTFQAGTNTKAFQSGTFPRSEYISQKVLDIWKSQWSGQEDAPEFIWQNWAKMVNGLNQAGVPLMVGTDLILPGILPGYSVHEEMAIWQEAGVPAADVLRSATLVPAQFMGLGNRLGSVRPGKTASMILVRANPLEDIHNAQQIEAVFLRGEYFSRQDLDRLLDEARDLARQSTP